MNESRLPCIYIDASRFISIYTIYIILSITYLYIQAPQIRSKVVGQSEAMIHSLFEKARTNAPCILLIDQASLKKIYFFLKKRKLLKTL